MFCGWGCRRPLSSKRKATATSARNKSCPDASQPSRVGVRRGRCATIGMDLNQWSQHTFTPGHCPLPLSTSFATVARALGVDPTNGTLVNLGARLSSSASNKDYKSNRDESWEMFFHNDDLRLRMVGFEGDPVAAEHIVRSSTGRVAGLSFAMMTCAAASAWPTNM